MRMHTWLTSTAALIAIHHCGGASAQSLDARDIFVPQAGLQSTLNPSGLVGLDKIPTDDMTAAVGRGYDPITGAILPTVCVQAKAPATILEPGTEVDLKYKRVQNARTNQSASESSFSFGALIKVVSLGFGHSSSSSNYFNSVDGFGRIIARVATEGRALTTVDWAPDGKKLIDDTRHPDEFVKKCGTYFVKAAYSGHLMDDWVHFSLRENQNTVTSANALSIGVKKIFSASLGGGDASSKTNCYADATLQHYGRGVLAVPSIGATSATAGAPPATALAGETPVTTAEDPTKPPEGPPVPPTPKTPTVPSGPDGECSKIDGKSVLQSTIDYYNGGFRAAVEKAPAKSAKPLYIIVDQYKAPELSLSNTKRIPVWVDGIIEAVSHSTDDFYDLVTAISDLNYALEPGPVERLKIFYVDPLIPDPSAPPSAPAKLKIDVVAKQKLKDANVLMENYKKAVLACRDYAKGPEKIDTDFAVDLCDRGLKSSLSEALVANVKLVRNYTPEPAP